MKRVALLILMALAPAAAGTVVRLSTRASVEGPRVTLGELAVIETPNPAKRARLACVVVDYLGEACARKNISSETVREALMGAGLNLAEIRISGASSSMAVSYTHLTLPTKRIV